MLQELVDFKWILSFVLTKNAVNDYLSVKSFACYASTNLSSYSVS